MKYLNLTHLFTIKSLTCLVYFLSLFIITQGIEATSTELTAVTDAERSPIPASDSIHDPNFIGGFDLSEGPFNYMYRGFTQAAAYLSPLLRASSTSSSRIAQVSTNRLVSPLQSATSSPLSKIETREMSSSANKNTATAPSSSSAESSEPTKPPLGLPAPEDGRDATKLDVSGEGNTIKFDHLGPIVVNQDGTMSRISNWEQMTEIEKKNTLRILVKRNNQRLEALKAAGAQAGETVDQ